MIWKVHESPHYLIWSSNWLAEFYSHVGSPKKTVEASAPWPKLAMDEAAAVLKASDDEARRICQEIRRIGGAERGADGEFAWVGWKSWRKPGNPWVFHGFSREIMGSFGRKMSELSEFI